MGRVLNALMYATLLNFDSVFRIIFDIAGIGNVPLFVNQAFVQVILCLFEVFLSIEKCV